MTKKAMFQATKNPVKTPQVLARCGVLTKKDRIFWRRTTDQNFGDVSDGV